MTDAEKIFWSKARYEDEVAILIREKYSENDELAILRQKDSKPEEFAEYNAYCEQCKKEIKEKIAEAYE